MKLARDKKRVILQLDNLDQFSVWRISAEYKATFFESSAIGVVEFVTMAMALINQECAIEMIGPSPHHELARLGTETHRAALFRNLSSPLTTPLKLISLVYL